MQKLLLLIIATLLWTMLLSGCNEANTTKLTTAETASKPADSAEYFNLRPKLEKEYGYSHAVR